MTEQEFTSLHMGDNCIFTDPKTNPEYRIDKHSGMKCTIVCIFNTSEIDVLFENGDDGCVSVADLTPVI